MVLLTKSLNAWGSPEFTDVLKREIERLDGEQLPLQQGLRTSSHAVAEGFSAIIHGVSDDAGFIRARIGVFFSGIIAGCSCADDPTPVEPQTEYCEMELVIDKRTGETTVSVVEG